MRITVTGASGLVGRRLVRELIGRGDRIHVLGRTRPAEPELEFSPWDALSGSPVPEGALLGSDAVVNLAGTPVAQRWTSESKRRIRASRVDGTKRLVEAIARMPSKPEVLVSASAVGYYGNRGDEVLDESSPPGSDFLASVSVEWERAASEAETLGVRTAVPRIGIVLDREGGALARMLPVFRLGLGGRLGAGTQWMSWIHAEDLVRLILFALDGSALRGPVNATAPNPVTNLQFTRALADALRRPALAPAPAFALKLLMGQMSEVLLGGQRAVPQRALAAGFEFRYPELAGAFANLVR